MDALLLAEIDDGGGDRCDVGFVERTVEARAAVPRGPEAHGLSGHGGIGDEVVIRVKQCGDVNKIPDPGPAGRRE